MFTEDKIALRIEEISKARVRHRRGLDALASVGNYEACEQLVVMEQVIRVPEEWDGCRVYLGLQFAGAETLVYLDGRAVQAIDSQHHDLLLGDPAQGGRCYDLRLEAYTGSIDAQTQGSWTGAGDACITGAAVQVVLKIAELQCIDRDAEQLAFDMRAAFGSMKHMDSSTRQRSTILTILDATTNLLDFKRGVGADAFYDSVSVARRYIQENLFQKFHADEDFAPILWATGHAHIDTAWLWRVEHARKKIERTFTTALALMDQYPDYRFSASQAQQYAYLKQDNPDVYARVKDAVEQGKWEPVGGMWVESDCNVISGESMVRQFLYGQRFFQREFGKKSNVVWLPDVFGYSAAFPQIIKKAGMRYFMTIKIFWNRVNKPPFQTFEWEGIDGTTVLSHFSPNGGYNSVMTPEDWQLTWREYQQKELTDSALYIYGFGDGGGGPTREMLETAERGRSFPGMPKIKLSTNEAFFDDLAQQVQDNPALPRWVGELYLECHRGTYTSQARIKMLNRRCEIMLQAAEQISVLAMTGMAYPQAGLTKAWELVLLNQFHDIIPGSSIKAVYTDSEEDYKTVLDVGTKIIDEGMSAMAASISGGDEGVLLYNPLSWDRSDVAELPGHFDLGGQKVTDLDGVSKILVPLKGLPALGYEVYSLSDNTLEDGHGLRVSPNVMENKFFRIVFDECGEISSLFDKQANREVIDSRAYCKGNALLTFEDKPLAFDAWDIDQFYEDKRTAVQDIARFEVLERGPIRGTVEIERSFGMGSRVRQRISLWRDIARVDFDTEVVWEERQTLLKVAFPVTVHSARATYDIQFGNIERPTHWNTSWDRARFEVCGHKWADLSEGDYGVSLLSDSKYGWDIKGNVMRLTLLKGAISPDPDADRGRHRFAYSLYPHSGDWRQAQTVRRAYEFNVPVRYKALGVSGRGSIARLPSAMSLIKCDVECLVVETVKKAEDDDAIIVRLFEAYGQRGQGILKFNRAVRDAVEVNLMEEEDGEIGADTLEVKDSEVSLCYRPYEIKTIRVTFV